MKIFGLGGVSLATIISITQLVKLLKNGIYQGLSDGKSKHWIA